MVDAAVSNTVGCEAMRVRVPLPAPLFLLPLLLFGCRHVDVKGQWEGPFPLAAAEDCRLKLLPTGRFELGCVGLSAPSGQGTYQVSEHRTLVLNYEWLILAGEPVERLPQPARIDFVSHGNRLEVSGPGFAGEWRRIMP